MANRMLFGVNALDRDMVVYAGRFTTDGSGDVSATTGRGVTASKLQTGIYRVTLHDKYPTILSASAQILSGSGTHLGAHTQEINGTTSFVDFRVVKHSSYVTHDYRKAAIDGAAGDATAELCFSKIAQGQAGTVTEVYYVPDAALTADNSNYATLTVGRRDAGGARTTIASRTTQITGSGDWTQYSPVALTISAASLTAAGTQALTFEITKTGTGVAVPAGALVMNLTGFEDSNLVSDTIEYVIVCKNRSIA